jgi:hypothetical protein
MLGRISFVSGPLQDFVAPAPRQIIVPGISHTSPIVEAAAIVAEKPVARTYLIKCPGGALIIDHRGWPATAWWNIRHTETPSMQARLTPKPTMRRVNTSKTTSTQ